MGLISCVKVDKIYMNQLDFLVCCADNQLWFLPLLLLSVLLALIHSRDPSAAEQREKTQHSPSCPSPDLRRYVMRPLTHKCATQSSVAHNYLFSYYSALTELIPLLL